MISSTRGRIRFLVFLFIVASITCCGISDPSITTSSTETKPKSRPTATTIVRDLDGNEYRSVTIGTQVWMAENLRVTHYCDETAIPEVSDNEEWSNLSTGAYCKPALDSPNHHNLYGLLYNFSAIVDHRGICPKGWSVPTADQWRTLIDHLGGNEVAGAKMKMTVSGHWRISVPGSTNESGFSAVPAGGRGQFGGAGEVGNYATWWSATSEDTHYAWHWGLHPDSHRIRSNPGHKSSGFSVRCIQQHRQPQ